MKLGNKINKARLKEGLTIRDVAEATELSIGFLSNLERDQNSPTLSNLESVCKALKISILDLIKEASEDEKVVITRSCEREEIYFNKNGVSHKKLNKFHRTDALSVTINKKSDFGEAKWKHNKDELGVVIEGELEILVDGILYHLKKDDSIFLSKNASHSYRNPIDAKSISHWYFI